MAVYLKTYLVTIVVFLGIDFVWLGFMARDLYREQLGFIIKESFDMKVALVFYLFFAAGLMFFVINRAVEISSWQYALFAGMFFGFITYATYDITNLATLKDWPVLITVIDVMWGTFLCGITSILSYWIIVKFDF